MPSPRQAVLALSTKPFHNSSMTANVNGNLPSVNGQYSKPLFQSMSFAGPCKQHSKVFNDDMSEALKALQRLQPKALVTGSAVLRETQCGPDSDITFIPGDVDVFMPAAVDLFDFMSDFEDELVLLNLQLCEKNYLTTDEASLYPMVVCSHLRRCQMVTFKIDGHDVPIQLIGLEQVVGREMTKEQFELCVLDSFDINICSCKYDVDTRVISFPTSSRIFWYVLFKKFFTAPRAGIGDTRYLNRVLKYKDRGFTFLGYWDRHSGYAHFLPSGDITFFGVSHSPNHVFLKYVSPSVVEIQKNFRCAHCESNFGSAAVLPSLTSTRIPSKRKCKKRKYVITP